MFNHLNNKQLTDAYNQIKSDIAEVVGSIFGIVTKQQINMRDALENEMIKRGLLEPEEQ